MVKIYPAVFHTEDGFWVEFPDLEGCNTYGSSLEEAAELAQEAMGLYLVSLLEDGKVLPPATPINEVKGDGIVSFVSSDIDRYRRNTRAIKKTLSIPAWLADEAEKANLSLSRVLQEAIKQKLDLI